jgi:hypothetical protein
MVVILTSPPVCVQTVILRGASDYLLDEVERSLHDAMCIVKRTLESNSVVPGGGAVETALSVYMDSLADTMVPPARAIALLAHARAPPLPPRRDLGSSWRWPRSPRRFLSSPRRSPSTVRGLWGSGGA